MLVSPDLIGIIVSLAAFCTTVLGGLHRMLARQTASLESRFERIEERFEKIDARFVHLEEKFDDRFVRIEEELSQVKVAIARLEGPLPRLQRL
jgi:thymidylate kinase